MRLLLIISLIISLFFLFFHIGTAFSKKFMIQMKLNKEISRVEEEIYSLQRKNLHLKQEIQALYTLEKIEELARERLGLTKENELVVKVVEKGRDDRGKYSEDITDRKEDRDREVDIILRIKGFWIRLQKWFLTKKGGIFEIWPSRLGL